LIDCTQAKALACSQCGFCGCTCIQPAIPPPQLGSRAQLDVAVPQGTTFIPGQCPQPSGYKGFAAAVGKVSTGPFQTVASGCCGADCARLVAITQGYFAAHPELGSWPDGQRTFAECVDQQCGQGPPPTDLPPPPTSEGAGGGERVTVWTNPDANPRTGPVLELPNLECAECGGDGPILEIPGGSDVPMIQPQMRFDPTGSM